MAARCRDRYNDEHSRAQTASELSELRHAHLKLGEKVQKLQLQSGAKSDMHTRIEKERDMAQAALNELKNAMREQGVLYEKCQMNQEKDFCFRASKMSCIVSKKAQRIDERCFRCTRERTSGQTGEGYRIRVTEHASKDTESRGSDGKCIYVSNMHECIRQANNMYTVWPFFL